MEAKKKKEISKKRFQEREQKRKRNAEHDKTQKERKKARTQQQSKDEELYILVAKQDHEHSIVANASLKHLFTLAKMHYSTNHSLSHYYIFQFNKLARNNDIDVNSVRSEFCQHCSNLLVPGVSCTITTEDASKIDSNNCSVFTNTKKLATCTKYTCELCKHETIYSGERKPIKQKAIAPIKILETKIQPIVKIPETKELKSMAIGTSSKQSKKKKKQETKEDASVSDFLNKLGI